MRQPHKGRGGARHVGRLRTRTAAILSEGLGFEVRPEDIKPATGAWRTDWRLDVYRWECYTQNANGIPVVFGCWESLTDFVRLALKNGFVFDEKDLEVSANKKPKEVQA